MATPTSGATAPIEAAREALTVRKVFGEAYEADGVTIIPVAKLCGTSGIVFGDGNGRGSESDGGDHRAASGGVGGFGVIARPAGVYVIADGRVSWQPALNLGRVILGGQVLGGIALVAAACVLRARHRS